MPLPFPSGFSPLPHHPRPRMYNDICVTTFRRCRASG
jgi:hypothetical protein